MRVKLDINKEYTELEVRVCNGELNLRTKELFETLKGLLGSEITAYDGERSIRVPLADIVRIFAANKQVFVTVAYKNAADKVATDGEWGSMTYRVKERLYEFEEKLPSNQFIRISNSELVNVKKIIRLDTSLTGTIQMYLKGDVMTYVSRRNVSKIKKVLEL